MYRSYGFFPIDTPSLEYYEILAGKGGEESDKQLYQFRDHGDRHVGMRFDLTVPLARFAAQHVGELGIPLKRYHIATVWRGERKQRGRYREFMQCDFDTIGTKSIAADIETTLVINELFEAIGFERFTICINNRRVLGGLLEKLDLADQATFVLRALDKLAKIGPAKVAEEMERTAEISASQAEKVLELAGTSGNERRRSEEGGDTRGRQREGRTGRGRPGATACGGPQGGRSGDANQTGRLHRARLGLLYRDDLRDVSGGPSLDRKCLQRGTLRQPGRTVHRAGTPRELGPRSGWIGSSRRWRSWR